MTNEEAKIALANLKRYMSGGGAIDRETNKAIDMAIDALGKSEPHWIQVTENTLPQKGKVVVVCGEKGTWDYGTYRGHGDDIHYWHWKKNTYKHVYWWMYKEDALPIPYKGDK